MSMDQGLQHPIGHLRVDDEGWEDVPALEHERPPSRATSVTPAAPGTPRTRRRKPGVKTVYVAQPGPRKPVSARQTKQMTADEERLRRVVKTGAASTAVYILDVVVTTLRLFRRPLSVLLFLYLLALLLNKLNDTLRPLFQPFCIIPGISKSSLCSITNVNDGTPQWADFPKLMDVQSATFEQLLDDSVGGPGLSLEIKKAEMATRDLVILVRMSSFKSKDLLVNSLNDFVQDGQRAGKGLTRFSATMDGAVDSLVAVNDYAMHSIEQAESKDPSALSVLWPFSGVPRTKQAIMVSFMQSMTVVNKQIERLILEAEQILYELEKMEQHMVSLHELLSREGESIGDARSDLLAELWTKLGGNQRELRGHDRHLELLRNLGSYRTHALAHVTGALANLRTLSANLEELRDRVATPELVGDGIPLEVQVRSIRIGIERLRDGKSKAQLREAEIVRRILTVEGADPV